MLFLAYLYWVGGLVVLMASGLLFFAYAGGPRRGLAKPASPDQRPVSPR